MVGMADSMPHEFWRWELIQETGWTLDQVDALSQLLAYCNGGLVLPKW